MLATLVGVRLRILVAAVLVGVAFVPAGYSRTTTTAPNVYISIHVTLTDSKVIVSPRSAPRGSDARFIVRNIGKKPRNFTVRTGALTGFSRVFKPGKRAVLLLYLGYRGTMPYYSGATFASTPAAMKGNLLIGATCAACIQDA